MKWTAEKAPQEIKTLDEKGEDLTPKNIKKIDSKLYHAAFNHCGSWGKAVGEVGIDYANIVKQPWTKECVILEIESMQVEGTNLSTKYIRENKKSLYNAAGEFYGSWKEACEKLRIKIEGRIRWNKEKVLTTIISLHEKGEVLSSRNITRLNLPLIKAATRHHGSWGKAVTLAGFNYEEIKEQGKKEGFKLRSKNTHEKYTSKEFVGEQRRIIVSELLELQKNKVHLSYEYFKENKSGLLHRMRRYFGSTTKAMNAAGIDYEKIKKQNSLKWNRTKILDEITEIQKKGEPLNVSYIIQNYRKLYRACVNRLDSWEHALGLLGIDYEKIKRDVIERVAISRTLYTNEFVIGELRKMKQEGLILSRKHVVEFNSALIDACYNRFGSLQNAIEEAGYDYDEELEMAREEWLNKQMKVQKKWTPEKVLEEVKKLHKKGIPLSTSYVKHNYQSLYDGANNSIGSWGKAVEAAGFNYVEHREDRYKASYCGQLFEKILDELLVDVGIVFQKYEHERWNPDYVLPNGVWIDAKLSQWTVKQSKTIERYSDHCRLLIIIYMRGRRGEIVDEIIQPKVRVISVEKFIKQLPKHKHKKYYDAIKEIKTLLNEFEDWID